MQPHSIEAHGLELDTDSLAVCVPIADADPSTLASLRGIGEHMPPSARLVLVGADDVVTGLQSELAGRGLGTSIVALAQPEPHPTRLCVAALAATAPADVVLIGPGVQVACGWLEGLRAAALSDSTVASASPLSLGPGGVELFEAEQPPGVSLDVAAPRIAQAALGLHPKIAAIASGCCYLRRRALALAGPLDDELGLANALQRLGLRFSSLGMVNVLADGVLIAGDRGSVASIQRDEPVLATLAEDAQGALQRTLDWARAQLRGLSVTIDGRSLEAAAGGTQTYILELILALAREPDVSLRVLVPGRLSERAERVLAHVPGLERMTYEQALEGRPHTDVVHRPQQVFTAGDLALLRLLGRRVVVGQQDMIAYHNPSYHADVQAWRSFRRATRLALAGSDQVIFFSEHAKRDALAEDLLPSARTHVAGIGAETIAPAEGEARPQGVQEGPFLLCLGADYAHKNRPFAIKLLAALHELGWQGRLVLAGPHVPHGSSREAEQTLLQRSPGLAELTVDLGLVDEAQRQWLFANASALVYPTLYEGFGLLPLEAAQANVPCLFAPQASLAELGGDAATLSPWDPQLSAHAALPLLNDGPARERHLERLRSLFPSWREVSAKVLSVYRTALSEPPAEAAPRVWQELDREHYIVKLDEDVKQLKALAEEYQVAYNSLESRVALGLPLIDEGGLLAPDEQRGLMRVASRRLGAVVLRPLGLLGRLGRR